MFGSVTLGELFHVSGRQIFSYYSGMWPKVAIPSPNDLVNLSTHMHRKDEEQTDPHPSFLLHGKIFPLPRPVKASSLPSLTFIFRSCEKCLLSDKAQRITEHDWLEYEPTFTSKPTARALAMALLEDSDPTWASEVGVSRLGTRPARPVPRDGILTPKH